MTDIELLLKLIKSGASSTLVPLNEFERGFNDAFAFLQERIDDMDIKEETRIKQPQGDGDPTAKFNGGRHS